MNIANPFTDAAGAARYQLFRPAYHHIPFQKLEQIVGGQCNRTLDAACGSGQSTIALSKISRIVFGCDSSSAMLAEARRSSNLEFVQAFAEVLPFSRDAFDLVNVSMGIHWLDQPQFLKEAARVLVNGGHLSIDNYGFSGPISQDETLQALHNDFYDQNLPSAQRNSDYPEEDVLTLFEFQLVEQVKYGHTVSMDCGQFCGYLMTQSNFLIQSPGRREQLTAKLPVFYKQIFGDGFLDLPFGGKLKLYRLAAQPRSAKNSLKLDPAIR